jgi:hypothetical protein
MPRTSNGGRAGADLCHPRLALGPAFEKVCASLADKAGVAHERCELSTPHCISEDVRSRGDVCRFAGQEGVLRRSVILQERENKDGRKLNYAAIPSGFA